MPVIQEHRPYIPLAHPHPQVVVYNNVPKQRYDQNVINRSNNMVFGRPIYYDVERSIHPTTSIPVVNFTQNSSSNTSNGVSQQSIRFINRPEIQGKMIQKNAIPIYFKQ